MDDKLSTGFLMQEIRKLPIFSERYTGFLVREYRNDVTDKTLFRTLTEQFLLEILIIAERCIWKYDAPLMEPEDLIEAGVKGLHLALLSFDPTEGAKLKTWIHYKVKMQMLTYIRDCRHTVYLPRTNKGRKMPVDAPVVKMRLVSEKRDVTKGCLPDEISHNELDDERSSRYLK